MAKLADIASLPIEVANRRGRVGENFFKRPAAAVAQDLIGRLIVHELPNGAKIFGPLLEVAAYDGETDSSAETLKYSPGIVGVSTKYGRNLLDIGTSSGRRASCVTLIAAHLIEGRQRTTYQGPGNLARGLYVDRRFDGAPMYGDVLWIGSKISEPFEIRQRERCNVPENFVGQYYLRLR